ncbi:hypothetical protein ACH3XW_3165 [Acanthocheilonema viteae]
MNGSSISHGLEISEDEEEKEEPEIPLKANNAEVGEWDGVPNGPSDRESVGYKRVLKCCESSGRNFARSWALPR